MRPPPPLYVATHCFCFFASNLHCYISVCKIVLMEYNFMSVPSYYSTSSYAIVEKDLISQLENRNYRASNIDANLSLQTPSNIKKCLSCETTKTPMWRRGPEGPKVILLSSLSVVHRALILAGRMHAWNNTVGFSSVVGTSHFIFFFFSFGNSKV